MSEQREFYCSKCGSSQHATVRYNTGGNCMNCECKRCGHWWNEEPSDKLKYEPEKGE